MVAEWLGDGLQTHLRRFDSVPSLQKKMQDNCIIVLTKGCQVCIIVVERVRKGFSLNNLNEIDYEFKSREKKIC